MEYYDLFCRNSLQFCKRGTSNELQGAANQKPTLFIVTAVTTVNITFLVLALARLGWITIHPFLTFFVVFPSTQNQIRLKSLSSKNHQFYIVMCLGMTVDVIRIG
jgi:hypothetical protein